MAYRTDGLPILRGGVWPTRPDGTMQEEEEEVEEKKVEEPKEASTLRPPRPQLPKPKPTTRFVPSASTLRPRPTQRPKPKPKPRFVPSLGSLRPPSPSAKPKPRFVPSVLTFPDPGPFNFNNLPDEVPLVGEEGYHAPPNSPAEPPHPGPGPSNSNNRAEEPPSLPKNFTEDDEAIRAEDLRQDRKDMQLANKDRRKKGKRPYKSLLEYWGFVGPDGEPLE